MTATAASTAARTIDAASTDPGDAGDAEHCARVTRMRARTFWLAAMFLPREKRRGAFALYAFCRGADDIVDNASGEMAPPRADAVLSLARYRASLGDALGGAPSSAVFREVAWAVGRFAIPAAPLYQLTDGVAHDLRHAPYDTWEALAAYCTAVASSVGEMCTHVFGVTGSFGTLPRAVGYGRTLGLAMQLTNILRDVGEDAVRGRCYLPVEDLARFGVSRDDVLGDRAIVTSDAWRALMRFEISRARALYDAASPGIALLAPDARRCATACARGYAAILDAIEARGYDTIGGRASVPAWRRLATLWGAWRGA